MQIFNEMDKNRYEKEKEIYPHFKQPNGDAPFFNYRLT